MKIDNDRLEKIKKEALKNHVPIIADDTLKEIENILMKINPKKILEIGTAVGYSASCFCKYLDESGVIDTIERNEKRYNKAIENINDMNLNHNINIIFGDANCELLKLNRRI